MYDEQGIVYSGSWSNDIPDDTYKRKNEEIQKPKSHKSTKKKEEKLIRILISKILLLQVYYKFLSSSYIH